MKLYHYPFFEYNVRDLENRLVIEEKKAGPQEFRNLRCMKALLPTLDRNVDALTLRSSLRQFWTACFDGIREFDAKLITPDFATIESAVCLLIAREEGTASAWEGLRVVRVRKK